MGEVADMVIEGILCQSCGVIMEDLIPDGGNEILESPGYPKNCKECK